VARLLLLRKFQSLEGAIPEKFLLYQLSDICQRETSILIRSLQNPSQRTLENIRDELFTENNALVEACILDESAGRI
jgi:hypothetical protein